MTITLQFSSTTGPISWIIRQITWSACSHVDTVLSDGRLLGAQWDGVKVRPANYQKFSHTDRLTLEVTSCQYHDFWDFLDAQLGKPYDKTAIAGNLFHRDWKADDSWFCSELIAAALVHAGILQVDEKLNRITPELLRQLVSTLKNIAVLV